MNNKKYAKNSMAITVERKNSSWRSKTVIRALDFLTHTKPWFIFLKTAQNSVIVICQGKHIPEHPWQGPSSYNFPPFPCFPFLASPVSPLAHIPNQSLPWRGYQASKLNCTNKAQKETNPYQLPLHRNSTSTTANRGYINRLITTKEAPIFQTPKHPSLISQNTHTHTHLIP